MRKRILSMGLAVVMALSLLPMGALAAPMTFTDVPANAWYYGDVQKAYDTGLIDGRDPATFDPNANMVYSEAVKLAACMHQKYTTGRVTLQNGDPWYQTYVEYAKKNNIITREYSWSSLVNRAGYIEIFAHALPDEALQAKNIIADNAIPDVTMTHTNADEIYKLYRAGVLEGTGADHTCAPENTITRAEVAAILTRMMDDKERKAFALTEVEPGRERMYMITPDLYTTRPEEENIVTDKDTGIQFVNNEMIIHGVIGADRDQLLNLFDKYDGTVVGEISHTNSYQVQFPETYTYKELGELSEELEANSLVEWTSLNLVFEQIPEYYPENAREWSGQWSSVPGGDNWGVEAIHAPEAWDYRDQMSYVNVGVIDNMFFDHEDLIYANRYFNHPEALAEKDRDSHGTHVSGTIAANFNNSEGIVGVAPYVNLYGFSLKSDVDNLNQQITEERKSDTFCMQFILDQLLIMDKCKVINFSQGFKHEMVYGASHPESQKAQDARESIEYLGELLGRYLDTLLRNGIDDFVICAAAGNTNNKQFIKKDKADYGYELYNPDNIWTTLARPVQGNVDALYESAFTVIGDNYPNVKEHIIVVGACKNNNNGAYTYSDLSNIGGRVDVVAPGEDIYSTVNGGYEGGWNGTSMATPHVSGIAAMLFSIDPTLTGAEVKKIITETATTDVQGCNYKMVNAQLAVERALRQISGVVIEGDHTDTQGIKDVSIDLYGTFNHEYGERIVMSSQTDLSGHFAFRMPEDLTSITKLIFQKDGFAPYELQLEDDVNTTFDVGIIKMAAEKMVSSYNPIISAGQNQAIAIDKNGNLWRWGQVNAYPNDDIHLPVPIKTMENVASACAAPWLSDTAVITEDGTLWTLSTSDANRSPVPNKVMDNVAQVEVKAHSYGAVKNDHSLWIWGTNQCGQYGNGTTDEGYDDPPQKVMDNVASVSIGGVCTGADDIGFVVALKMDGSVWTWGYNAEGQLGNGGRGNAPLPWMSEWAEAPNDLQTLPLKIMDHVIAVSAGERHAAAIKDDGTLWMWGENRSGELGNGTTTSSNIPIKVMDDVVAVSTGFAHTAAIKSDGSLWVWGDNYYGQLGNGKYYDNDSTVPINIMNHVVSVSASAQYTMAVTEDETLWTWGSGPLGNNGNGNVTTKYSQVFQTVPEKIMNLQTGSVYY